MMHRSRTLVTTSQSIHHHRGFSNSKKDQLLWHPATLRHWDTSGWAKRVIFLVITPFTCCLSTILWFDKTHSLNIGKWGSWALAVLESHLSKKCFMIPRSCFGTWKLQSIAELKYLCSFTKSVRVKTTQNVCRVKTIIIEGVWISQLTSPLTSLWSWLRVYFKMESSSSRPEARFSYPWLRYSFLTKHKALKNMNPAGDQ